LRQGQIVGRTTQGFQILNRGLFARPLASADVRPDFNRNAQGQIGGMGYR
jgi:hypothetical protein